MSDPLATPEPVALATALALARLAVVGEEHVRADERAHATTMQAIGAVSSRIETIAANMELNHAETAPAREYISSLIAQAGRRAGGGVAAPGEADAERERFLAAFWRRLSTFASEPPWMVRHAVSALMVAAAAWLAVRLGVPVEAILPVSPAPMESPDGP